MTELSAQFHNLNGKWDLYYHLPSDTNWNLSSYKEILKNIDKIEDIIMLNNAVSEGVVKNCMLFLMRNDVTPLWEDPKNRNGGCFSFKVLNKQVYEIWKTLCYTMCGESLTKNSSHMKEINGITISPKKHFCIVKIWLGTCKYQDPNMFIDIPNLQKQTCLFKKHEPEF